MCEFKVQDICRAALVRGLAQVLLHRGLTQAEKSQVAAMLESEIETLVAKGGEDDIEIAKAAVALAVQKYRASQRAGRSPRKYLTAALRGLLAGRTRKQQQAV
jgi:hypothetical protein